MTNRIRSLCIAIAVASAALGANAAAPGSARSDAGAMTYVPNPKYFGASKANADQQSEQRKQGASGFGYKPNPKYLPPKQDHRAGN